LVQLLGECPELVELGSGSAKKTRVLIRALHEAHGGLSYRPIDVSAGAIEASSGALLAEFPGLRIDALAMEYTAGLASLRTEQHGTPRRLVLWLGSSIGNFSRGAAAEFLTSVREEMALGDRMLVGIDLRKDKALLEAAYDDAQGVTAAFNKNLLVRINRELHGNFDLNAFRHEARYLVEEGRIEMWLISKQRARVQINALDLEIAFEAGEGIHTESSHKYSAAEVQVLARSAGFVIEKTWTDSEARFCDVLLAPAVG